MAPSSSDGFVIRTATPADAAAIRAIYAPFVEETTISFEESVPSVEEMAGRIDRTRRQFPYYVADMAGVVAGYAYGTAYRSRQAYQWGAEVSVYVDPAYQRRGIATALYETLIGTLVRQGYVNVYAGITLPNDASVAFHEGLGFSGFAIYENVGYKFDAWHDVGWWVLFPSDRPDTPQPPTPFPDLT